MADAFIVPYRYRGKPKTLRVAPKVSVRPPLLGLGFLSGEFPSGITTVDSVPVPATVRVLLRATGELMAQVQSAQDGSWIVLGLEMGKLYDVVGRKEGFKDIIVSEVTPTALNTLTVSGKLTLLAEGLTSTLEVDGGLPPFSLTYLSGNPPPDPLQFQGRNLVSTPGVYEYKGPYDFMVRITSANAATLDLHFYLDMEQDMLMPAKGGEYILLRSIPTGPIIQEFVLPTEIPQ